MCSREFLQMLSRRGWRATVDTGRRNLTGEKMLMLLSESQVLNPWPRYRHFSSHTDGSAHHTLSGRAARAEVRQQCGWIAVRTQSAEGRGVSKHPVTFASGNI